MIPIHPVVLEKKFLLHISHSFTGNYIVSIEKCNANGKRGLVFINQLICWYLFWIFFQDDKSRVEIFKEFAKKNKESVWVPFLHLLNRDDRFIVNQVINSLYISIFSRVRGYILYFPFLRKPYHWGNRWHAHVECYRSWVRAQIGQNTIKFAFAASPLRPKKICVFTVTRLTLIFASDTEFLHRIRITIFV